MKIEGGVPKDKNIEPGRFGPSFFWGAGKALDGHPCRIPKERCEPIAVLGKQKTKIRRKGREKRGEKKIESTTKPPSARPTQENAEPGEGELTGGKKARNFLANMAEIIDKSFK